MRRVLQFIAVVWLFGLPSSLFASRYFDIADYDAVAITAGAGNNWYLDPVNGSDSAACDAAHPCKTYMTGINGRKTVSAGTRILLHAGIYHDRISISAVGTAANPIIVGPIGDGEVIFEQTKTHTWTNVSGNIWSATWVKAHASDTQPAQVVVPYSRTDYRPLMPACELTVTNWNCPVSNLTTAGWWAFDPNAGLSPGTVYVWLPDGADPNNYDVGVLGNYYYSDNILGWGNAAYVHVTGITSRFAGASGFSFIGPGHQLTLNRAIANMKAGIIITATPSPNTSTGFEAIRNEIWWNCMTNWPRGRTKYGAWPAGLASQSGLAAKFEGNISHKNGGEGINAYGGSGVDPGGGIARDNISYDNWSMNFYLVQTGMLVERNLAYNSPDVDYEAESLHNNDDCLPCRQPSVNPGTCPFSGSGNKTSCDWVVRKRQYPAGFGLGEEQTPANMRNSTFRNNIVISSKVGFNVFRDVSSGVFQGMKILGNTVVFTTLPAYLVTDTRHGTNSSVGVLQIGFNNPKFSNTPNFGNEFRNNIFYSSGDSSSLAITRTDAAGNSTDFDETTFDHNLFYYPSTASPFMWGSGGSPATYSHAGWCALAGTAHCTGNVTTNPNFVDATTLSALDKALQAGSPAIDAGATISGLVDDWLSNARGGSTDIGAMEYGAGAGGTTLAIVTQAGAIPYCVKDVAGCSASFSATGGTEPYTWDVSSGSLCTGMALSSAGVYSGTPTVAQTCSFTARVTDNAAATATVAMTHQIQAPTPSAPATRVVINPGATSAIIRVGTPALTVNAQCTLSIAGDLGIEMSSGSGPAMREFVVGPLNGSSSYQATAVCPGVSDPTIRTFTTQAQRLTTVSSKYSHRPTAALKALGATKLFYMGALDTNSIDACISQGPGICPTDWVSCADGCTITGILPQGLYYRAWIWTDNAGTYLARSPTLATLAR